MKYVVGISQRAMYSSDYSEPRDAISHDWIRYLDELNVIPVLIPNSLREPVALTRQTGVQALLLTGGGDVSPQEGEAILPDEDARLQRLRDRAEHALLDWAVEARVPVLGVCRGLHSINVYFGGRIVRDLADVCGSADAHAGVCHEVTMLDGDFRRYLRDARFSTNSFHRQAITMATLSAELRPFAVCSDGVIEGVHHPSLPILGIQWHPERANSARCVDERLVRAWLGGKLPLCT